MNLLAALNRADARRTLATACLLLAAAFALLAATPALSQAACSNPVQCENQLTGTDPSQWQIDGAGDRSIQGYATQMSVTPGQTINFKISSATSNYRIDILRLGYYGGLGARRLAQNIVPSNTASQSPCQTFSDTGLVDCGNWTTSASYAVPSTAVSGVYIAYLHRLDTGGASHIIFVVRSDTSTSKIVLQTSDATWQAYNTYGGNSLYTCTVACPPGDPAGYKAAYKVSYNRPNTIAEDDGGRSALFSGAEYPMIRFLERNGYDVSYLSQVDVEQRGNLLLNHKLYISSGHDEYTSGTQRANIEAARDAGVNLAFFSGNEMFWKTRYENSAAGPTTAGRTLVSYKDTHFPQQQDPVSWTGTWRDNRFAAAGDNVRPENALIGQSFTVNSGTTAITVPAAIGKLRMWKNTDAATLPNNGSLTLGDATLGYEWDEDVDNGFRPAGEFHLSQTTVSGVEIFDDYGTLTSIGSATHTMSLYRAPSGAKVFGAGTVQWAWGLDDENYFWYPEDENMQQATVNLLADMGAQPTSLMSNLTTLTASTDATAPTALLTAPPATVADGAKITLTGTATDAGGGAVAGIEVSTDNGTTWHPATGTTSWSYQWVVHGYPSTKVRVRAVDDSGNIQTPAAGPTVNITCSCSVWGDNILPSDGDSGDPTPVEVGMKFKSDAYGTINAIRFFKAAANTGTHTGSLWTADGTRLAQVTFSGETSTGWQTANLSTPVAVLPNTTYVVSYFAPNGHYVATNDYFYRLPAPGPSGGSITDSGPLHALRSGGTSTSSTTNGVFAYSGTSTFPNGSYGAANYWVDVKFTPTAAPGAVSGVTATAAGKTSADVRWTEPTTGGTPTSYKVTPYIGATAQTTVTVSAPATSKTVTGLTTGTTYTFKVQAVNPTGDGPVSASSNSVTPLTAVVPTAPTGVSAKPATRQAVVTWTAPDSDGDSALTTYTITPYIGATAQPTTQVPATQTSATVTGLTNGSSYTFKVTATNGVGSGPVSSASGAVVPQATIFDFATPSTVDSGDITAVEVGTKFKADYNGTITGVRFYKAAANTGLHVGSLWSVSGTRLAQVTFTDETASGWQTATFSSPVNVTAGTTYVASYYAPSGHYSATSGGLSSQVDNGMLHAIGNGTSPNGVYAYGTSSTFPANSWNSTNYSVDVLYAVPAPGTVTGVAATQAGQTSADLTWNAPSSGGPVTAYRITPYVGATAQTPTTVAAVTSTKITGLTTGTTYTFTVQALNANGSGPASAQSNAVTPTAATVPSAPTSVSGLPASKSARVSWTVPSSDGDSAITGYVVTPYDGSTAGTDVTVGASTTTTTVTGLKNGTAYTFKVRAVNGVGNGPQSAASPAVTPYATVYDFATPSTVDSGDTTPVELGVKFKADIDGAIAGIRFYKAAANNGTHIGRLWTAAGAPLASATFTNESASGWQTVTFSSPVSITAGTTYVASYYAPNGHYSVTGGGLANGADNVPLHAIADSTSANGLFAYGSGGFPSNSYNAGDYAVDVLFDPAKAPGTVTGVTASPGQGTAAVSWTAPSTGGPVQSYKITPYIGSVAQTSTTITGAPPATSKTITGLNTSTAYTFTVTASNVTGSGPESSPSAPVTPGGATVPGAPTGVSAVPDTKSATVSWTAPANDGGSALTGFVVTPYIGSTAQTAVNVGASATSATITGLTNDTAYTFKVAAKNAIGTGTQSAASASTTPLNSIFESATPTVVDANDASSVVLGVKFTADRNGSVAGVRFYKAPANTGTHVGELWTSGGTSLRQATFTGETASGWQTVLFSAPVAITAGTTYVVSYLAPNGHYSVSGGAFGSGPVDNPPLHALGDATSSNGVYANSSTSVFPNSSWNATNYYVDVLFG